MKLIPYALTALALLDPTAQAVPEPEPGHSHQGEAFDEGPRQFATLRGDTGPIDFNAAGCSDEAKQFIDQGIGQLHGFLNYEAERSFRHAAYLDDNCVFAFWGIAKANTIWIQNIERATKLIEHARSRLTEMSSPRERLYVESIEALADQENGAIAYLRKMQTIWQTYPGDIDAKAFFVKEIWQKRLHSEFGFEGDTYREQAMHLDRLAREVLEVEPLHPVHHYLVHMWDNPEDYSFALEVADNIGFSGPDIAHLWHMGGHIYSQAKLPFETWWSQEAAARTDHAYMAETRIFPFLLHNHAHNNEWLSRTLMGLGNFDKARRFALNLLAQARHPQFNRIDQYQHLRNGVLRTLELIELGEFWELGVQIYRSPFMHCAEFGDYPEAQQSCLRVGKVIEMQTGESLNLIGELDPEFRLEIERLRALREGSSEERDAAFEQLASLEHLQTGVGLFRLVRYGLEAHLSREAIPYAEALIRDYEHFPLYLLLAAATLAEAGEMDSARTIMAKVRPLSQEIDLGAPFVRALTHSLQEHGLVDEADWRTPFAGWRTIERERPELADLGPLLWQPPRLANFQWVDKYDVVHDFETEAADRPAVLVFLLNECPRCDVQYLLLEEQRARLESMGVALVAVTSQEANMSAFRSVGAYDDFESIPIHGLYLVNAEREIVWQDVSADAFLDVAFLMTEVERAFHPYQSAFMRGETP